MKKLLISSFALLWAIFAAAQSIHIDPALQRAWTLGETADLLVVLREQADISALARGTKMQRAESVYTALSQLAARTQANVRRIGRAHSASLNSFALVNMVAIEKADAALGRALAELPEVAALCTDPWVQMDGPVPETAHAAAERSAIEWGVAKINAPAVWAMGYRGQGITVGGSDTGYDWAHPALQPSYRGASNNHNYHWHDAVRRISPLNGDTTNGKANPCGLNRKSPCDDSQHGTHTMGSMTGDDRKGNQIGVAPGAKWVGCRNMERGWGRPSTYIECLEWFLAPRDTNGLNPRPALAPHVINNSWYCAVEEGCTDARVNALLQRAIVNLKASGVVVVVSNGNNGPRCQTTNFPPAYFPEGFSVGATRIDDFIAGFSSRGPVDGSNRIKPDVSAPGESVRSCIPGGDYSIFSGTSMAGPHVAGAVALLLSANPRLAGQVEKIEDILEKTAVFSADTARCGGSVATARPNHAYGWGRIDVLAAVRAAIGTATSESTETTLRSFPSPTENQWFITAPASGGPYTLELFRADGRLAAHQMAVPAPDGLINMSLSALDPGIYFWQLRDKTAIWRGKVVKI